MNPNVDKCEEKEGIVPPLENSEELVVDSQPVPMDGPVELSHVEVSVVSGVNHILYIYIYGVHPYL
jgi:hypothetical protein